MRSPSPFFGHKRLKVPEIGLGTGRLWPAESIAPSMHAFLVMGGRHLDTADRYWSQSAVASVCRASGVPAKDIVITTKIWPSGFKESLEAAREALQQLDGVGQVVMLLHAPGATVDGEPKGPKGKRYTEAPESCRDEARPSSWRRCRVESFLALASLREAGVVSDWVHFSDTVPFHFFSDFPWIEYCICSPKLRKMTSS